MGKNPGILSSGEMPPEEFKSCGGSSLPVASGRANFIIRRKTANCIGSWHLFRDHRCSGRHHSFPGRQGRHHSSQASGRNAAQKRGKVPNAGRDDGCRDIHLQGSQVSLCQSSRRNAHRVHGSRTLGDELLGHRPPGFSGEGQGAWPGAPAGRKYASPVRIKIITKGGEERWLDVARGTIELEGELAGIVTAYDITERKQAEKEIASLAKFPSENPNPVLRLAQTASSSTPTKQAPRCCKNELCSRPVTPPSSGVI